MRTAVSLIALLLTTGAAPAPDFQPVLPDRSVITAPQAENCTDRIHEAREERGLPKFDRDNAAPDEPLPIAAVDRRIDGCSVLVMMNDPGDVRPLPTMPERPARLRRAR